MRVIKSRRPKSALNAVKQKLYSPFISQSRMSGIQNICKTEGLDCVLMILGIDSRFNRGCTELIEYLLFDMLATRKDEIQRTNADEVLFEDLMICVHPNFVEIYCNPVNYWLLIPYIAHWPGLRLHCLSESEYYEDPDKAEDFKVEILNRMVSGAKTIGVPYFSSREDMKKLKFDKMMVEHWPVVQATALEETSGGPGSGFFTLNHSVVDISTHVHSLLLEIDSVYLETFYDKVLPPFEKQFESMFQILDVHRNDTEEWTSNRFAEPLTSYFQHGSAVLGNSEMKTKFRPFVLFGKATEKMYLQPALNGQPSNTAVPPQVAPSHFVVQGAMPRYPDFVCARTYFLLGTSTVDWRRVSPDNESERQSRLEEIKILFTVYESLVKSIEKATALLQEKKSIDEVIAAAKHLITRDHQSVLEKQIEINVGTSSPEGGAQIFHLQGIVYNLTTPSGNSLGSVMYGDAVIVSILQVTNESKEMSLRGSSTRLSFGLPRFHFWAGEDLVVLRKELSETYGEILVMDTVSMVLPCEDGALTEVSCVFYESHVLIHHKRHGNSLLPLISITYFEGESIGDLSFLLIPCPVGTKNATAHLSRDSYVVLVVQTKTRFKNVMYSKLIPMWKNAGVLEWCDQLPPALASTYAFLQARPPRSGSAGTGVDQALARQPGLRDFLKHLEVTHCLRHRAPLLAKDLAVVLPSVPETEATTVAAEEEAAAGSPALVLTVVCGLPGSYKEQLCACLTRLVKDETRWMVLRPPNLEALESLRERLASAVTAAPRRPVPGQSRKTLRALLCCPGFVGPAHVARLVEGLSTVRIGAVTVCVDPASAFVEHKLTMPLLLDQCANGWANNVIFTAEGGRDSTNVEDLQALLRCLSPKVTTIHAAKGELTLAQEIDAILSENAFALDDLRRARLLGCHGLLYPSSISCIPPALEEHHIQFDRPVSRSALMKVLKNMKSTLKPWPYVGNIYFVHGKVTFPQGGGRMLEFWHSAQSNATWTQNLEPLPAPPGAPPAHRSSGVTFIGCRLDPQRLKEWLRLTAPPAPVRRALRTRADVTEAELEKIHKDKHLSPLPTGWFYNGIQYMTMDGTKHDRHPDFERHVEEFLGAANEVIEKHNKHIETLDYHDLFDA